MNDHTTTRKILALIALFAVIAAGPIFTGSGRVLAAQGSNGSLIVTIKDQAGAAIAGATVTATNIGTAQATTAVSNETGVATFALLPVGSYTVNVEATNFQKSVFEQVVIDVGRTYGLVAELAPGGISESVTVTAGENIVSSTNAELTNTVTPKQVSDLPLDGRDPLQLIQLQAGVSIPNGRAGVTINGQRTSSGVMTQDGIPIQDYAVRENALSFSPNRTTVSGVSEFSVTSQNAGPDQAGASSIRIVTPSGTNDFHGEVFEYHRNDALGANDWFNNAATPHIDRPQLIRNQFGFAVDGPVYLPKLYDGRNKLFFFGAYEGFRERSATPFTTTVLTPEARAGVFQYLDSVTNQVRSVNLHQLKTFSLDPITQSLLTQVPLPNSDLAGDGLVTSGYSFNKSTPTNRNQGTTRIDYVINDRHKIEAVYQYTGERDARSDIDGSFNQVATGFTSSSVHFGVVGWNWNVSDRLTNGLRAGVNNSTVLFGVDQPQDIPYFVVFPLNTDPQVAFDPQLRRTIVSSIIDDASYVTGNHFLRFGFRGDLIHLRNVKSFNLTPRIAIGSNTTTPDQFVLGSGDFPNPQGVTPTTVANANALIATLAGVIDSATREYNVPSKDNLVFQPIQQLQENVINQVALYVSDQWHVSPKLTLSLGVRWDYISPLRETQNRGLLPTGSGGIGSAVDPNGTLDFVDGFYFRPDRNNFGPNLGAAWDIFGDGKTVLRGGFSVAYINDEAVRAVQLVGETNPGLNTTLATGDTFGLLARDINRVIGDELAPPAVQIPLSYSEAFAQNNQLFIAGIDPTLKTPYYQQWNVGLERELGWDTAVGVHYVGNRGRDLLSNINYNNIDVLSNGFAADVSQAQRNGYLAQSVNGVFDPRYNPNIRGSQPLPVFASLQAGGLLSNSTVRQLIQQGRAADLGQIYFLNGFGGSDIFVPNPSTFFSLVLGNQAFSNYNALQVEVRRRFSKDLGFQANYTFGKAYGFGVGTQQQRQDFPFDVNNLDYDKRRLLFDTTHNFKANAIYDLPFGDGRRFDPDNSILEHLASGWSMTSIINWNSGAPISVNSNWGTYTPGSTQVNSTLTRDQIKDLFGIRKTPDGVFYIDPRVIGPDGRAVAPPGQAPFDGQAFFLPGPGELGTLQFLQFNAPSNFNWDASLIKNIALTERVSAQLRFEFFNILNQPIFFITSQDVNSVNFGRVTQTLNAPRVVQFAAKIEF
ncbi:MAG TPA: carboxypeptidase-like regulatory domain-containing protein [Blastocatellia bacterium]|nr:carboxypeptidase-like regulatory domain-containing protein [Blastocatellia bacterium]